MSCTMEENILLYHKQVLQQQDIMSMDGDFGNIMMKIQGNGEKWMSLEKVSKDTKYTKNILYTENNKDKIYI